MGQPVVGADERCRFRWQPVQSVQGTLQGDTAVRPGWFKRSRLTGNSSDAGDQNKQDKQTGQKHDVIDVDADGSNNDKSRLEGQPQQGDLLDNVDEG